MAPPGEQTLTRPVVPMSTRKVLFIGEVTVTELPPPAVATPLKENVYRLAVVATLQPPHSVAVIM